MEFKLGKQKPVFDDSTLSFGAYLKPQVPPAPATADYNTRVPSWPMYLNDRYGDCACAAAGHMIEAWTASAGAEVSPPDQAVLTFYEHFVGTPPPPDQGCSMLAVLKYWRKAGLATHKVLAFAGLEPRNQAQVMDAVYMFGAAYIGVALPDFAVQGDPLKVSWTVPASGPVGSAAPNPNNGHCIPAFGYDSRNLYVVTWGTVKPMSWGFYNAYMDEAYAVLSEDFIAANGKNEAGFDLATLRSDLAAL